MQLQVARNRNKVYKQGDRINIYLSRDLTSEFVEWINKQSDLSNFFLYAAQQLYQQTGFVDVSEVMPRKINFELSSEDKTLLTEKMPIKQEKAKEPAIIQEKANKPEEADSEGIFEDDKQHEEDAAWSSIQDLDDPFA